MNPLPLRNVPVITPALPLTAEELDIDAIAAAGRTALPRLDLHEGEQTVALCYHWQGSASLARLNAFPHGTRQAIFRLLGRRHPLILVGVGALRRSVSIHIR